MFYASLTVLSRRITPSGNAAFVRITALGLQKELGALSPAELAD
jgi:hypothetical protein